MPESQGGFLPGSTLPYALSIQISPEIHGQASPEDIQGITRWKTLRNGEVEGSATNDHNRACRDHPVRDRIVPIT